jgi:hypothetical protein
MAIKKCSDFYYGLKFDLYLLYAELMLSHDKFHYNLV